MMLSETIENSTFAIKRARECSEEKNSIEKYKKALNLLDDAIDKANSMVDCVLEIQKNGIIDSFILNVSNRNKLLESMDNCGNAIQNHELTIDKVKDFQIQITDVNNIINLNWNMNAYKYAESTLGYLEILRGLLPDPRIANELIIKIKEILKKNPNKNIVCNLVLNVDEAKKITNNFSLTKEVEIFLKKVSSKKATLLDLDENIVNWLKDNNLISKIRLQI